MILVELPRHTAADLAEAWGTGATDCPAELANWLNDPQGGAGAVRSRLKVEKARGVMDCHDMDLFTNESVYDSIGALNHFAYGGVIDLWNSTARLGQCGEAFNGGDESLGDELGVVRRILRDKLPDRLHILNCPASPDQLSHLWI